MDCPLSSSFSSVFVTGATGFIGSHLCAKLKKTNKVVVLFRDIHPSPWGDWLKEALSNCVLVRGDILDDKLIRRILAEYDIQHVYHLAAQSIVKTALKDPTTTMEVNIMGTVNLLDACRKLDVEKIYVMSTDKVYGNRVEAQETDPLVSNGGVYPVSKACQDLISQSFMEAYGLNIVIGRACNCYGYDLASRIVSNTIRSCMRGDPPIIYEGEEATVRQYIYVEDLVDAINHLMRHPSCKGAYNIATADILSQEQVVKTICKFFPMSPRYVKREKPLHEIKQQSMIMKDFGWKPKFSFEQGIQRTIERFEKYGF